MKYNPFEKDIQDLELADLKSLIDREIIEGWYIEYKSQIPSSGSKIDNLKVSKSISAFANTKGGWIFWGIECTHNKPTSIPGIDISGYRNFEDQVSQLINSNITPCPLYHFKTIQLENNNIVLVIEVEESPTPPYINSQGIIYQRENNESKPIHDRYILEKLNEKTERYYKSIEKFCSFDLPETKGQGDWNQTYLELYIFPLPFNSFEIKDFYQSSFFKKVSETFFNGINLNYKFGDFEGNIDINLKFNSIYSSERSLIIRPLNDIGLIYKSTTVELFDNGNIKFLFPLYEFTAKNIPEHYQDSEVLSYILHELYPDIENEHSDVIKIIDGHEIFLVISLIVNMYKAVLENSGFDLENKIGFRSKITDYWRKFIFFDNLDYLDKIKKYNIPLSPKNEIEIPEFKNGKYYSLGFADNYVSFLIAKYILESIGVPDSNSIDYVEIIKKSISRFQDNKLDI